jgi:hypothetical protein
MYFSTGLQVSLGGYSPHLSTKVHKRGRCHGPHALHRRSMVTLIGRKTRAWELMSKLRDAEVIDRRCQTDTERTQSRAGDVSPLRARRTVYDRRELSEECPPL